MEQANKQVKPTMTISRRTWCWAAFQLVALVVNVGGSNSNIPLVMGVDLGTESARVGLFDLHGKMVVTHAVPYETYFPAPGWAEQAPSDWWTCLGQASRECLSQLHENNHEAYDVVGLCVDTTACSVVALDKDFSPLRRCLLWCDARSAPQCKRILEIARGDPALDVNCAGDGPLSAEWMVPKSLWLKENEPQVWDQAAVICEKQDFINYLLTGKMVASGCNVAARWHWNAEQACSAGATERHAGRPVTLLQRLSLQDLLDKWPDTVVPMGGCVGPLTAAAAQHLGLTDYCGDGDSGGDSGSSTGGGSGSDSGLYSKSSSNRASWRGIRVTQGGPDAYVGMLGLGCVREGQLALITGSSHLHLAVCSESAARAAGVWGPYDGAPLQGLRFAEGGQSSSGSSLAWFLRLLNSQLLSLAPPVNVTPAPAAQVDTKSPSTGVKRKGRFATLARLRRRFRLRAAPTSPTVPLPTVPIEAVQPVLLTYAALDAEAAALPAGAHGLLAVETFQGSRTPVTDAEARGALLGMTLSHTRAHVWRALMEAVCYGTRAAVEALAKAGITSGVTEMAVAGGATRSPLWLQMHADVTGLPVVVGEFDNAPLLGAALLAAVGSGSFDHDTDRTGGPDGSDGTDSTDNSDGTEGTQGTDVGGLSDSAFLRMKVQRAARAMVRERLRVEPDPAAKRAYDSVYAVYQRAAAASREISHALVALGRDMNSDTGGNITSSDSSRSSSSSPTPTRAPTARPTSAPTSTSPSPSPSSAPSPTPDRHTLPSGREALVMPSILAADFGALADEAQACFDAGAAWLHVDVCDGSAAAGGALTL